MDVSAPGVSKRPEVLKSRKSAKAEMIVEAAIDLLRTGDIPGLTMSKIADRAQITRTSIYNFFPTPASIIKAISDKATSESWQFISKFAKAKKCTDLESTMHAVIDGSCAYFNSHPEAMKTILGGNSQYQLLHSFADFDKLCASMIHAVFSADWPFVPLSDEDPFRSLGIMQSALYSISVQKCGRITSHYADQAKLMSAAFIKAALDKLAADPKATGASRQSLLANTRGELALRLANASSELQRCAGADVLEMACLQVEAVVALQRRKKKAATQ